jgi:subfamily B ATP-binding cassette protein MsbA
LTRRKNSLFFGPFAKHLRPRKVRLVVALVCMLGLSFCSTYNILLFKPALDVLFSKVNYLEREAAENAKIVHQRQKLAETAASTAWKDRISAWWKTQYRPIQQRVNARVFGNSFYAPDDFVSPRLLVKELRDPSVPSASALRDRLSTSTIALLRTAATSEDAVPSPEVLARVSDDLNGILVGPNLVRFAEIEGVALTSTTLRLATRAFSVADEKLEGERVQVNRAVLDRVYPRLLATERDMPFYQFAEKNQARCLRWLAGFIAFMALLSGLFEFGFNYNLSYAIYGAIIALKSEIFRHVLDQDMRFFNERSVGFLMNRVTGDVQAVGQVFDVVIKDGLLQSFRMVFLFSLLVYLQWHMTALLLLFIVPTFAILAFFARSLRKVARKQKKRQDVLSAAMNESLGNIRLVKALATEDLECERFDEHNAKLFHYEMNRRLAKFAASPIMECLGAFAIATALIWASWAVFSEKIMDPSDFMVYAGTLILFYKPIKSLSKMNVNWQNGAISAERMGEMLSLHPAVTDPPQGVAPVELDAVREGIAVHDVTFAYDQKIVLDHVTIRLPAGTTTAIVGRSGSGKTTLANLLLRLYDPDSGHIEIDDRDIRNFRLRELRSHFGIVTQETLLFDDTVAGNIAYGTRDGRNPNGGRGEVNMKLVVAAGKAANAHEFIMALDGGLGYLSPVGPRGGSLSGGQRQRLAIARAFYRDPQILLLDEATSALDTKSEAAVQKALYSLMEHRTVIVIAHRLSTIMHAQSIVVLHEGKVVEQGTHPELIALGGHYAMLYNLGEFSKKEEPVEVSEESQPD